MKNKILWALGIVLVVSIVSLGITYAYRGDASAKGPNYSADVEAQLEEAMDAGDYDAWLKIRQDNNLPMNGRIFEVINADNFDMYVEMHEANLAGDTETANSIREELGLGQGRMGRHSSGSGCSGSCSGTHEGSGRQGAGSAFVDADNDGRCDNYALHHGLN